MSINKFEQLIAWQKAQDLAVAIYNNFAHIKDFSFKDQIQRDVISISNNVAEGFDRSSKKEFVRFLNISVSSGSEVKSMLYLAPRLHLIKEELAVTLIKDCEEVCKIINGLGNVQKVSCYKNSFKIL
ncbi:MAG: four helix bundle protein [Saprospiraceae bacterium]|nr:four helix bundle protein [Candidatus Brachybacter algidus]